MKQAYLERLFGWVVRTKVLLLDKIFEAGNPDQKHVIRSISEQYRGLHTLVKEETDLAADKFSLMHYLVCLPYTEEMASFAKSRPEIMRHINDVTEKDKVSPLHVAACSASPDWVNFLLKNGAKPNGHKISPLHVASVFSTPDVVNGLLAHGAEIGTKDSKGDDALNYSIKFGRLENIFALLKSPQGQDIVITEPELKGLHAVAFRKKLIKSILQQYKLIGVEDINRAFIDQESNLSAQEYFETVKGVLKLGKSMTQSDKDALLIQAVRTGSNGLFRMFLKQGADPLSKDSEQKSALDYALAKKNVQSAKEFIYPIAKHLVLKNDPKLVRVLGWSDLATYCYTLKLLEPYLKISSPVAHKLHLQNCFESMFIRDSLASTFFEHPTVHQQRLVLTIDSIIEEAKRKTSGKKEEALAESSELKFSSMYIMEGRDCVFKRSAIQGEKCTTELIISSAGTVARSWNWNPPKPDKSPPTEQKASKAVKAVVQSPQPRSYEDCSPYAAAVAEYLIKTYDKPSRSTAKDKEEMSLPQAKVMFNLGLVRQILSFADDDDLSEVIDACDGIGAEYKKSPTQQTPPELSEEHGGAADSQGLLEEQGKLQDLEGLPEEPN